MTRSFDEKLDSLVAKGAWCPISEWTILEFTGSDRQQFLHSFCTADIKGMASNEVVELFVLNGKGKTIGHGWVANLSDQLLFVGHGDQVEQLTAHFDRYLIREDVTITNRSEEFNAILILGEGGNRFLQETGQTLADGHAARLDNDTFLFHAEIAGPCCLLIGSEPALSSLQEVLEKDFSMCDLELVNYHRLRYGTPWYGVEVDDSRLPQELDRDDKTINFEKGCYLGQETVARIDSLGQVNKLFRVALWSGTLPNSGDALMEGDKEVGVVLSVASFTGQQCGLASVMVKRPYAMKDKELVCGESTLVIQSAENG